MTRPIGALARITLTDATVTATLIDAAIVKLDLGIAGWPEQTPGASPASGGVIAVCRDPECNATAPCATHDPDGATRLTATERLGTTNDTARRDLEVLQHAIRSAARAMAVAARITHRWGLDGVTDAEVKTGLAERLNELWCRNCAKAGISTVKRQGRDCCTFCDDFRTRGTCGLNNPNQFPAPKALLDIWTTGRKLNSGDVVRVMTAVHGENWNRKLNKKGRGGRAA